MNRLLFGGILYGILSLAAFVQAYTYHQSVVYQADTAKEWLWRARATNDLADMTVYLSKSEAILETYHGNPAFWFPTPDTDYDLIRSNIQETIRTAADIAKNQELSSFAYQQAVQNLQETIIEITEHLSLANRHIGFNPTLNPLGYLWLGLMCVLWIPPVMMKEKKKP